MAKDKFQKMKEGGGSMISSFQEIANTVAAIEQQAASPIVSTKAQQTAFAADNTHQQTFTRLPNPQIPISEYNLVNTFILSKRNMTRQDWVELAIIEKLHNDGLLDDDTFNRRTQQIQARPPRGQRKGFKNKQTSK